MAGVGYLGGGVRAVAVVGVDVGRSDVLAESMKTKIASPDEPTVPRSPLIALAILAIFDHRQPGPAGVSPQIGSARLEWR